MLTIPAPLRWLSLLLLAALVGAAALARDDEKKVDPKDIEKWIDQLGDCDETKRKEAEDKLIAAGDQALDAIRKAAKEHLDADVKLRAGKIEKLIGQGKRLIGHKKNVRCIIVSKDGKTAVSCGEDKTIRVWDLPNLKESKVIEGHKGFVWALAFTSDEKELASSGGPDKTVRLWNLEKGDEIRKYEGFPKCAYAVAISPDDKYVLGGAGGDKDDDEKTKHDLYLFEKDSGKLVKKFEGHNGYVWRATFSPDGKKIASAGCNDNSYRIWDVETGKTLVHGKDAHEDSVTSVVFSSDGKHLFTGGWEGKVKQWDAETGKVIRTYDGLSGRSEAIALSKDGKRLLSTDGPRVALFDVATGKMLFRYAGHTDDVLAVAFLPDGSRALSGGKDHIVRLWKVPQ